MWSSISREGHRRHGHRWPEHKWRQNITAQMFSRTFVPHFHILFSLPAQIANIAYQNKATIYDILFLRSDCLLRRTTSRIRRP
jgi:hypothetical protein